MPNQRRAKPLTSAQKRAKAKAEYEDAIDHSKKAMDSRIACATVSSRIAQDHPWDTDIIEELNIKYRNKINDSDDPRFCYTQRSIHSKVNHDIIAMCRSAYRRTGVVRTTVDLLANFVSKINIFHPNEKWQNFYRAWAARVELNDRVNTFVRDALCHGQVYIYRTMADISDSDRRSMRNAKGAEFENDENTFFIKEGSQIKALEPDFKSIGELGKTELDEEKIQENFIPWGYTSLNPLQMEPNGGEEKGESLWRFMLMRFDLDKFGFGGKNLSGYIDEGKTYSKLPKDVQKRIKPASNPLTSYDFEATIPEHRLYVIYDKKFDWERFAVPFIYPALKNIRLKDKLRGMEARAAESVMSSLMLIKLGHIDNDGNILLPPPDAIDSIGDMLKQPGESTHLIWGTPDIEAEYIQPKLGDIFGREKIEGVDADILADLGASEVVVNGRGGGNYSNSFLSVAAMLERLQNIREKFKAWIMHELRLIGKAVGDTKMPSITFEISSLRDERVQNDFMLKLAQMGRLSSESLWEYAQIDPAAERRKIKDEQEDIIKGNLPVMKGPFKDQVADAVTTEKMEEEEEGVLPSKEEQMEIEVEKTEKMAEIQQKFAPKEPGGAPSKKPASKPKGGERGRPSGTTDRPHTKKRDTKPKGMGQIDRKKYEKLLSESRSIATKVRQVLYRDALLKAEVTKRSDLSNRIVDSIEDAANRIHSIIIEGQTVDKELVHKLYTEGPAKLDRCVSRVTNEKVASYKKKNGKAPDAAAKKKIVSSAWAICRSSTGL